MDASTLARLDALAVRLGPGRSRSDALRAVLQVGLTELERGTEPRAASEARLPLRIIPDGDRQSIDGG